MGLGPQAATATARRQCDIGPGPDPELVVDGGALGALAEAGAFALVAQRTAGGDDRLGSADRRERRPMTPQGFLWSRALLTRLSTRRPWRRPTADGRARRGGQTAGDERRVACLVLAAGPQRRVPLPRQALGCSASRCGRRMAAAVVSPSIRSPAAPDTSAADADGVVAWAELGRHLAAADPMAPGGWRTDADRVAEAVARALAEPGVALVAVDSSDIARALSESTSVDDGARTARLQAAYHSLQELLEALTATLGGPSSDVGIFVLSLAAQDEPGLFLGGHRAGPVELRHHPPPGAHIPGGCGSDAPWHPGRSAGMGSPGEPRRSSGRQTGRQIDRGAVGRAA